MDHIRKLSTPWVKSLIANLMFALLTLTLLDVCLIGCTMRRSSTVLQIIFQIASNEGLNIDLAPVFRIS
jgi:hypothetical protein